MNKIYRKFRHPGTGEVRYFPIVGGRLLLKYFHKATDAENYAHKVMDRYSRMKMFQATVKGIQAAYKKLPWYKKFWAQIIKRYYAKKGRKTPLSLLDTRLY